MKEIGDKGIELIKRWEGFRNHPYLDGGGVPTIGYGFTYYPTGEEVRLADKPLTKQEADGILKELLFSYEKAVNQYVTTKINQNQFDALVSFAYNCGINALQNSTLLKKVNQNPNDPTIKYEFERWKYDNGKEIKGLKRRRKQEAYLYYS